MQDRFFGHIAGFPPGSVFDTRQDLAIAGVHRPLQAGISGSGTEGADSIVLSGGYEDDQDDGAVVIYTGQGGRDITSGKQVEDQELTRGNLALAVSQLRGLPVRVVRGSSHKSPDSPGRGYRYDGLWRVDSHWHERGKSGFLVWRFRLEPFPEQVSSEGVEAEVESEDQPIEPSPRREARYLRIVRDTKRARAVKELYDYRCQVCGVQLVTSAGPYAEAAHIRPLGKPHDGPDQMDNLICLCPNHHVLFDNGAFSVADDYGLLGLPGTLTMNDWHKPRPEFLQYHREHFYSE